MWLRFVIGLGFNCFGLFGISIIWHVRVTKESEFFFVNLPIQGHTSNGGYQCVTHEALHGKLAILGTLAYCVFKRKTGIANSDQL